MEEKQKVILCAIHPQNGERECLISLGELERLCDTADCECVGIVTQSRETPDVRTVIGSGKVKELSELCVTQGASLVIFDRELTPSQIKAIEDDIDAEVTVIDRSMLILDIFADHARTSEGRLTSFSAKRLTRAICLYQAAPSLRTRAFTGLRSFAKNQQTISILRELRQKCSLKSLRST